jgi:hypothetical protein
MNLPVYSYRTDPPVFSLYLSVYIDTDLTITYALYPPVYHVVTDLIAKYSMSSLHTCIIATGTDLTVRYIVLSIYLSI